jgi:hypothetical protein
MIFAVTEDFGEFFLQNLNTVRTGMNVSWINVISPITSILSMIHKMGFLGVAFPTIFILIVTARFKEDERPRVI